MTFRGALKILPSLGKKSQNLSVETHDHVFELITCRRSVLEIQVLQYRVSSNKMGHSLKILNCLTKDLFVIHGHLMKINKLGLCLMVWLFTCNTKRKAAQAGAA